MAIPGFTGEQALYTSKRRYRSSNHHSGSGRNVVSIAACPGIVTGTGRSVGDARFFPVPRFNLAFGRARLDAQAKCPPGCIFNPFPIGGAQGIGITRVSAVAAGRPIEFINIQASFMCTSPPRPPAPPTTFTIPSGVRTAVTVVAVAGLAALFVVAVIDPVPGDEVAIGSAILALL